MAATLTRFFPLWALLLAAYAWWQPTVLATQKAAIVPCLMVIMLGMGMTLSLGDFRRVLQRPWLVLIGVFLQFLWMPFLAFVISTALALPSDMLVGMVLVGSVAGGTASNVICYLARGDVALSISMTLISTLVAIVATPVLTWLYVGETVPVPMLAMLTSLLKIVLLPLACGLLLRQFLGRQLAMVEQFFPLLSVAAIVYVIGIIVALNADNLNHMGPLILLAVILHNAAGLLSGYTSAWLCGQSPQLCRTMAIEVGMQNSGLAVALASQYFSAAAALPGALFSIWHNLSGSLLASWWARELPDAATPAKE